MLPQSLLAFYRQRTQHAGMLGTQQVPEGSSASITSADAAIPSPPSGDYAAVGSLVPQLAATLSDRSGCSSPARSYHPGQAHPEQGCSSNTDDSCTQFLQATSSLATDQLRHPTRLQFSSGATVDTAPTAVTAPAAAVAPGTSSACHIPQPPPNTSTYLTAYAGSSSGGTPAAADADTCTSSSQASSPCQVPVISGISTLQPLESLSSSHSPTTTAAAGDTHNSSVPFSTTTTTSSSKGRRLQSLPSYIEEIMMQHSRQQPEFAELSAGTPLVDVREQVRQLMTAAGLQAFPGLYIWLNDQLHGVQIRTAVRSKVNDYKGGVAYLVPLAPADIYHRDPMALQDAHIAPHNTTDTLPSATAAAGGSGAPGALQLISCEQYLLHRMNVALKHQNFPCVTVKRSTLACQGLSLREQFLHYPAELCSVLLNESDEAKRGHPCDPWPKMIIKALGTPPLTAAVPPWVAEALNCIHQQQIHTAASAPAAATPPPPPPQYLQLSAAAVHHTEQEPAATPPPPQHLPLSAAAVHNTEQEPAATPPPPQHLPLSAAVVHHTEQEPAAAALPRQHLPPLSAAAVHNTEQEPAATPPPPQHLPLSAAAVHNTQQEPAAAAPPPQHLPLSAAPVHHTEQEPAAAVLTRGQHTQSSVKDETDGLDGAASSTRPATGMHTQIMTGMSAGPSAWSAAQHVEKAMLDISQQLTDCVMVTHSATAPGQQVVQLPAPCTAAAYASTPPRDTSSAAGLLILADARAFGLMMATVCNNLQTGHLLTGNSQLQANTAAVQPTAAALAAQLAGSVCHLPRPVPQLDAQARPQGSSIAFVPCSSSVSNATRAVDQIVNAFSSGSTANPVNCSVGCSSGNSPPQMVMINTGFEALLGRLLSSRQQKKTMSAVLNAVCQTIEHKFTEKHKAEWHVAGVVKAGSFAKGSSLNGSSDLDVVVKLICHKPFHQCRKKFLAEVTQHLCRPTGSTDKPLDSPECGWVWKDCHVRWFAKLEHPVLGLQLDIQVAQFFGDRIETRTKLLGGLLETAQRLEELEGAGATHTQRHNVGAASSNSRMACGIAARAAATTHSLQAATCSTAELCKKVFCDRQRGTDLTESSTDIVTGVTQQMRGKYGVEGMGRLCTDVIRMMKAWSKYGLPTALAAAAAPTVGIDEAASTVADPPKGPPGYLWEIVVVAVLWEGLEQGKEYNQGRPLQLFLDVLQAASKLRSTMKKPDAVIMPRYYSRQQALMKVFQDEWGADGAPYAPYIISPVDPTYNCTENAAFRDYDALADAADQLYQQVKAAQSMMSGWQWLCENSTLGPVAAKFGAK